jgi:hypothetical protein
MLISAVSQFAQPAAPRAPSRGHGRAKQLYFSLLANPSAAADEAQDYLRTQIAAVQDIPADLPQGLEQLAGWVQERAEAVGNEYQEYLAGRKRGGPRRYFGGRAHALNFLQGVAPTKLVDGAWLYGMLRHWANADFYPLIRTYLEELGDGVPDKNHVTLYGRLLANHGCEDWHDLDEHHFVQGAIQLALAHNTDRFLPEVIGYNLGYEQLPLHLLITSYELNELGLDPYYFTLHVTVDNAGSGHARKAVQALHQLIPPGTDRAAFYRRVLDGYRLNELGASTTSVIAEFDAQAELVRILAAKSAFGKNMHSDYCRVAGRAVNDWLSDPAQIPAFLAALERAGWIKRGEPAQQSRFWRLVEGERAEMFGVFSAYELQVLHDWITAGAAAPRVLTHRARQRTLDQLGQDSASGGAHPVRGLIRRHPDAEADADNALRLLEERVAGSAGKHEAMTLLAGLMAPGVHHTALGLMATRMYAQLLDT